MREKTTDIGVGSKRTGAISHGAVDDPLTFAVIGAAQKVHTTLGMGFAERVYQIALEKELAIRGIPFETQRRFEVSYEGVLCGTFIPDLVVATNLIVELKATEDLCKEHRDQTRSYLKATGLPTGLLLNFGATSLQVRRFDGSRVSAKPISSSMSISQSLESQNPGDSSSSLSSSISIPQSMKSPNPGDSSSFSTLTAIFQSQKSPNPGDSSSSFSTLNSISQSLKSQNPGDSSSHDTDQRTTHSPR